MRRGKKQQILIHNYVALRFIPVSVTGANYSPITCMLFKIRAGCAFTVDTHPYTFRSTAFAW